MPLSSTLLALHDSIQIAVGWTDSHMFEFVIGERLCGEPQPDDEFWDPHVYTMHVSRPDRRDRLLLISALAIAVLSLLGAAGERIGYDRWLKANTVKRRTHSLFRQGLMLYHRLPNWPKDRIRPLMETFESMLMEQRVYREVFGVI